MTNLAEQVNFLYHRELGGLEMVRAQYRHKNFAKHCHETYTISVIETGVQKFYRSGGEHFAPEHSIILVNADDVHTGQAADGVGWSYQAIYPTEAHFQQLAANIGWSNHFAPYFPQPVVYDPELAAELRSLFQCLNSEPNSLKRETLLNLSLTKLMVRHGRTKQEVTPKAKRFSSLVRARDYLNDHLTENIQLEQLAQISHLSVFYLVKQFQQQFGLTPHAYQLQQKLKRSKQLLKQGHSVVETSMMLGFHDQSHFHRHFKKSLGISPGQFAIAVNKG
ncbi:AraC family transcriptional regulator [Thalassotalea insulae]|uniref:AraC family transcriptional regulator n=1 Tax=Thalassotalea insulae TaxID=2056778 RepID=A0ABQ6GXH5_9GAMM|nr:AraC family transcriptional regulator [Thalassotalea insulae]GLX79999.1 AraC family transcriptional regulator [Thalassotalea insulae]